MKLRAVEPEDARLMYEADNDDECRLYSDYIAPLSMHMLEFYARNYDADPYKTGQLRLIIESDDKTPVGIVDLYQISLRDSRSFVGIYILPAFRRKNIAYEALRLLKEYAALHLAISRLVAEVPSDNVPSLKLFQKAGFHQDAVLPEWKRIGRNISDIHIYSLPL